jgi:tripartite-type tricarboxylate transporter receptor subunit TctC
LPGYDLSVWYGVAAPAGTPKDIVAKLNAEFVRVLDNPDFRQRLEQQGVERIGSTPEQFGKYIRSETAKWAKVVRASGARID